jgi:6-phospho-beta-glucosidase
MRLCVFGGSSVATVQLAEGLVRRFPDGLGSGPGDADLVLIGRNSGRLNQIGDQCRAVLDGLLSVRVQLDGPGAFDGADVVLVQARIGGLEARRFDESFPHVVGLPGEETLGPGGLANALRTVRGLEEVWDRIAADAADALVVVLTNPAGIVRAAAARHGLNAVEVCESPHAFLGAVGAVIGQTFDDLATRYVGLNHAGFFVPDNPADLPLLADCTLVDGEVVAALAALPLPYLRYYLHPRRQLDGQKGRPTRAEALMQLEAEARSRLAGGEVPNSDARPAPWYELAFLPLLDAWWHGATGPLLVGAANEGRLPSLPDGATIEGPVRVPRSGAIQPLDPVPLPKLAESLLARHALYEELALEAALDPTPTALVRALLANPMVTDAEQAERLADLIATTPVEDGGLDPSAAGRSGE